MTITLGTDEVRQVVIRTFDQLGAAVEPLELVETVQFGSGKYWGRTYQTDRLTAKWIPEAGLLKFFDDDGNTLRVA